MSGKKPIVVPGANTLRGGKSTYGPKTLNSNWVEDRKAPDFSGAKSTDATEQAARALEGAHSFLSHICDSH